MVHMGKRGRGNGMVKLGERYCRRKRMGKGRRWEKGVGHGRGGEQGEGKRVLKGKGEEKVAVEAEESHEKEGNSKRETGRETVIWRRGREERSRGEKVAKREEMEEEVEGNGRG